MECLQCVYFKNKTTSQNTLNEKETRHVTKLVFNHVMSKEFSYIKKKEENRHKETFFCLCLSIKIENE